MKMLSTLKPEFQFAGFTFPKYAWILPKGPIAKRIERMRHPVVGEYYHAPKPIKGGEHPGAFFYLNSDFMPGLRWKWCDETGANITHTGWFCDDFDDQTIRGIVMRLPCGRGFLAGWSMGEHMASAVDGYIWDDEHAAAHAADQFAHSVAEEQREYGAEERDRIAAEEAEAEAFEKD